MTKIQLAQVRKAVATLIGGVLTWCSAALVDGSVTTPEWIALGVVAATALGVYSVPNEPAH